LADHADYLVVGRPVVQAKNPRSAAEAIISEIAAVHAMIEVNIDDRDDGAMTELVPAALGDKNGGAAAFARAFPCGRREL
jgi:hypothetical protein